MCHERKIQIFKSCHVNKTWYLRQIKIIKQQYLLTDTIQGQEIYCLKGQTVT